MSRTPVQFRIEERVNVHTKQKNEYAFDVRIDEKTWWTVMTFNEKPSIEQEDDLKNIVMRSFEIYHRNLTIPQFDAYRDE